MKEEETVETLQLSQYPGLTEAIKKVRQEGSTGVPFPQSGTGHDGKTILRCSKTIDREYFLMVLEDGSMFYIFDDVGLE